MRFYVKLCVRKVLILREVVREEGLERDIWQYFTVLPGIQSVGVMGDYRTYDHTVVFVQLHLLTV